MNNNQKATKRALLTSVMALVMCVVMLVGTTFAWFTDTASTAVNKIQAGNLDIELLMHNGSDYVNISKEKKPIFSNGTSAVAQNDNLNTLWEPGKTQVAYLAIKNEGNLALKYKVALNVTNPVDGKDLYKVMQYAIVPDAKLDSAPVQSWTTGKTVTVGQQPVSGEVSLAVGATHYFALLVHMDELAGNNYQNGKVDFDLTVYATQLNSESDSFGPDYDKDAYYYDTLVTNLTGLTGASVRDLEGTVAVSAQTYDLSQTTDIGNSRGVFHIGDESLMNSKVDTLILDGGVMTSPYDATDITGSNSHNACISVMAPNGAKIIVRNMTFNGCFAFYDYMYADQYGNRNEIEFVNCTFNGVWQGWTTGYTAVTFKGCTFTNEGLDLANFYTANAFQTWFRSNCADTVYTYDNCTFKGNRGIHIESKDATVNVTNCIFNLQASSAGNEDVTKVNAIKLGADIGEANITGNTMNSGHAFFDVKDASKVISSNNIFAAGVSENK